MRIAILKAEDGFPARGLPPKLTPEWFVTALEKAGHEAVLVDIADTPELDPVVDELLLLPYGESIPAECVQPFLRYYNFGGQILTTAGRGVWDILEENEAGERVASCIDPYEDVLAQLGFKWYEIPFVPEHSTYDKSFLDVPELPEKGTAAGGFGIVPSSTDGTVFVRRLAGNTFPDRIPVQDWLTAARGCDAFETTVANQIVLLKDWHLHRRHVLISQTGEGHVLNPENPWAEAVLARLASWISHQQAVFQLETDYACYRQEKTLEASVRVKNWSGREEQFQLRFSLADENGQTFAEESTPVSLSGKDHQVARVKFDVPGVSAGNLFHIKVDCLDAQNKCVDEARNAFVVWNPELLSQGVALKAGSTYFHDEDGKAIYVSGINYAESRLGEEHMWLRPNVARLAADFDQMAQLNLNRVRIHYHHSKWFRDFTAKCLARTSLADPEFLEAASTTPMPSERDLRIFDMVVCLCHRSGITFEPDILTLVPEELGNSAGWSGLSESMTIPEKTEMCARFVNVLAERYKDVPGMTWDLLNEADYFGEPTDAFCTKMREVIREQGDERPITLGSQWDKLDVEDYFDYITSHGYEAHMWPMHLPHLAQEIWNNFGNDPIAEDRQREVAIYQAHVALGTGACGYMPWGYTRQAKLWGNAWKSERWDDELGVAARSDDTIKPAGHALASVAKLIESVSLCEPYVDNKAQVVMTGRRKCRADFERIARWLSPFHVVPRYLPPDHPDIGAAALVFVPVPEDAASEVMLGGAQLAHEEAEAGSAGEILTKQDWAALQECASGGAVVCFLGKPPPEFAGEVVEEQTFEGLGFEDRSAIKRVQIAAAGEMADHPSEEALPDIRDLPRSAQWKEIGNLGWLWSVNFAYGKRSSVGAFSWIRVEVELEESADCLRYDQSAWQLLKWGAPKGFWTWDNNVWVWLDGEFVGKCFGWGESRHFSVQADRGRHELLILVRDPWFLGTVGQIAIGTRSTHTALERRPHGGGHVVELFEFPQPAKGSAGDSRIASLLDLAGVERPPIQTSHAEGYQLVTENGDLCVFALPPGMSPESVRAGECELDVQTGAMVLARGQKIFLVECASRLTASGKVMVESRGGSAVVIALDQEEIPKSRSLLVKLREGEGEIRIQTRHDDFNATVVDARGRRLGPKTVKRDGDRVVVEFCGQETSYWTLLQLDEGQT